MSEEGFSQGVGQKHGEATERDTERQAEQGSVTRTQTLRSGKRIKRLVMNVDEEMHRQLRREALEADMSLTSYVIGILEQRSRD